MPLKNSFNVVEQIHRFAQSNTGRERMLPTCNAVENGVNTVLFAQGTSTQTLVRAIAFMQVGNLRPRHFTSTPVDSNS